jgi:hypothetical protein
VVPGAERLELPTKEQVDPRQQDRCHGRQANTAFGRESGCDR